ncbi:cysteine synthase A [Temperatibacter marinus]|uniref:Cysteine synthase n=1 Tax=Temperatibacter marinus TaxID=1456591 RepID=A0AA52HBG5_9PROT|nr:cysteine synthase A [Temperatibacter marinus]WND03740.1 cysteine synthase A [Temperatibacter marinus]
MRAQSILDLIGNTAHVRVSNLFPDHEVWIKQERSNPGGSIKDRIALAMITAAEEKGDLKPGGTIIEPTSGNTGIGLAMVAAVRGYRIILVMPESMSIERRRLMLAYGAEFDLTPKELGMKGAIARAEALVAENEGAWMPAQFENPANIAIHEATTAQEIAADFPEGLDYMVTGVGTGGHFSGVSKVLKEKWPAMKAFAVEPDLSPVLSGGDPSPHPIQGIGAGFVPKNMNLNIADQIVTVAAEDAKEWARRAASKEAMLVGISSGATLAAIHKILPDLPKGSRILGFNYDTGERYLSIPDFLPTPE